MSDRTLVLLKPDAVKRKLTGQIIARIEAKDLCGRFSGRIVRGVSHGIGVSPTADGQNHVAVVCNGGFVVVTHNGGATWTSLGSTTGANPFPLNGKWYNGYTPALARNTEFFAPPMATVPRSGPAARTTMRWPGWMNERVERWLALSSEASGTRKRVAMPLSVSPLRTT